ncbi:SET domain-containing protein-lysine N-methyltransferase [bacterium]|nr:SET domain-containing protein-lysine N-methyltransferase [bacterium]
MHLIKFVRRGEHEINEFSADEFSRSMGIEYLPRLKFQNDKILLRITKHCMRASDKDYIHSKRKWLGALYAEQIRSATMADVSIRWIDDTLEYGLFAEKDMIAWEFIGEYTGVVRRHYPIFNKINDYCFLYPTSRYFFGKYFIDGEKCGNEIRYANHSDRPNSESTGIFSDGMFHMILRAIKDIPAGAQITYDYGDRYWKNRPRIPNLR